MRFFLRNLVVTQQCRMRQTTMPICQTKLVVTQQCRMRHNPDGWISSIYF